MTPLESLIAIGTKLWLDSIDPELVAKNRAIGATGATSNPIIVADLIRSGRFDNRLRELFTASDNDEEVAWQMTDALVQRAQETFADVWQSSGGDDGYVSFEIDPLLEDPELGPPHAQRVAKYIELGKRWSAGNYNRLTKVPATPAGIDALEELAAAGVKLNVTLIFAMRQYQAARDAIWRGAQRAASLNAFKSVYSIFISRVDVYTAKNVPELSGDTQGLVGIVGAKRIWAENQSFWRDKNTPLAQEIVFASTGAKLVDDPPYKYVQALAGSDVQTNPPDTNDAVQQSGLTFARTVDQLPPAAVLDEIDDKVDQMKLEQVLVEEGVRKFADPHKQLLDVLTEKRRTLL